MHRTINTKKYCFPVANEVGIITNNQSLSVVLGSCISTVFLGRGSEYVLAANHILIADPKPGSIAAKKSALELIDEILLKFHNNYNIDDDNILCLYLLGAGKKISKETFLVHESNIKGCESILKTKGYSLYFNDTKSHISAFFSIYQNNLSVFIENIEEKVHISFILNMDLLFDFDPAHCGCLPAVALMPMNEGFEYFINKKIITAITGSRFRSGSK